jgi:hypothetical protein
LGLLDLELFENLLEDFIYLAHVLDLSLFHVFGQFETLLQESLSSFTQVIQRIDNVIGIFLQN